MRDSLQLTGMEFVQGLANGQIPEPPMKQVMPFDLMPPEPGKVTLRAEPDVKYFNLTRTIHGGWIMTMLDTAMALAAYTLLEPGEMAPTHETTAKFLRPISKNTGPLLVTAQVLSKGRSLIALDARIEDESGRLYAHGTSSCFIVSKTA